MLPLLNTVQETDPLPTYSEIETINVSTEAPVYDFYEIDKCFPPTSPNENVMAGEEQRLIPIYICKPLRQVIKMTPLQIQQAEVLKELARIDEMEIEVSLPPPRSKSDHQRKTRLVPLAFVSTRDKLTKEASQPPVVEQNEENAGSCKSDSSAVLIQSATPPKDIATHEEESPEKPQFQCDRCEKSFYLKRAMLRHLYSHK